MVYMYISEYTFLCVYKLNMFFPIDRFHSKATSLYTSRITYKRIKSNLKMYTNILQIILWHYHTLTHIGIYTLSSIEHIYTCEFWLNKKEETKSINAKTYCNSCVYVLKRRQTVKILWIEQIGNKAYSTGQHSTANTFI